MPPLKVLDDAFSRMAVTYDPIRSSLLTSTRQAFDEAFSGQNAAGSFRSLRSNLAQPSPKRKEGETRAMTNYVITTCNNQFSDEEAAAYHSKQMKLPVSLKLRARMAPRSPLRYLLRRARRLLARKASRCAAFSAVMPIRAAPSPPRCKISILAAEIDQGEFVCINRRPVGLRKIRWQRCYI